ncbi:hypothetical protein [Nocardia tenerifensis]|nr:hypothetical protein [Nocardia tenerifensis]
MVGPLSESVYCRVRLALVRGGLLRQQEEMRVSMVRGIRLRAIAGALLAAVTLVLVLAGCGSKGSDSAAPTSKATATSVAAKTMTPTSWAPLPPHPGVPQVEASKRGDQGAPAVQPPPGGTDNCGQILCGEPPAPQPGGTDNCGQIFCGELPAPRPGGTDNCNDNCGALCTERFDYTGDPRSPAEINAIAQQTGKCPPPPIKPTPTPAPSSTTPPPATTVTTSPAPEPTATTTAK